MSDIFDDLVVQYESLTKHEYSQNPVVNSEFINQLNLTRKKLFKKLLSTKNDTKLKALFSMTMQQLTEICDALFEHSGRNTRDPHVQYILEILGKFKQALPQLIDRSMALPKVFRIIHGDTFQQQWLQLVQSWQEYGLSEELIEIASLPITEFAGHNHKLSWFHFIWTKRYLHLAGQLDMRHFAPYISSGHLLQELLIKLDFNHTRFTGYCFRQIQQAADAHTEKEDQIWVLKKSLTLVSQFSMLCNEPYFTYSASVAKDICEWISAEEQFRAVYDPDFFKETGEKQPFNEFKFQHELNIEQLSFWYKLQLDHGIFKKENLRKFCKRLSYNCATASNDRVVESSFWSKMYTKDINVIGPIYDCIKAMSDELQSLLDILKRMEDELLPYVKFRDRKS